MQWRLSEEQDIYRSTIRDWLRAVAPVHTLRQWYDAGDPGAFEARFAADGWPGVGVPEEHGGQGGGLVELALTAEELARAAAPSAAWLASTLVLPALAAHPDLAEAAVALSVPADAIPDAAVGVRLGAGGTVHGTVPRVLAGDRARRFVVPAGGELRVVEADAVHVVRRVLLDRTRSVADITMDGAPSVPLDADPGVLLGEAARRAAVLVAADTLGATQRMLDMTVEYSKQRHQFGRPIGSFQAVKHAAATMLVGVEAARSAVYFAAASVDGGHEQAPLHAAAVKAQVTAEGVRAADSALTLHGAVGYTAEHDLRLFFQRAKLNAPLFGTPCAWNERLADALVLV